MVTRISVSEIDLNMGFLQGYVDAINDVFTQPDKQDADSLGMIYWRNKAKNNFDSFFQSFQMRKSEIDLNVGYIRGYWNAIGELNSRTNEIYTLSFDMIPWLGEAKKSLEKFLETDENFRIELIELNDWQMEVIPVLRNWFIFPFTDGDLQIDESKSAKKVVDKIKALGLEGMIAWKVEINILDNSFYEASWDDILFMTANKNLYFLHLGVSD